MKKFKAGIVGCGGIFPLHAYSLTQIDNIEITAVCDIKKERAEKRAAEFNCECYTDYKEMILKSGIDVVHICTPHYVHAPIAIFAAENGVNILTEKPMSILYEDALKMIDTAKEHGVTLGVIFQNRFNPGSVLIKNAISSGELGSIMSARLSVMWKRTNEYYSKDDWRGFWATEGGGAVINQAIHTVDLMNWFIDSEPDYLDVYMANRNHPGIEVEDIAEGSIVYKNSTVASFYITTNHYTDSPVEIELHCEKGFAKITASKGEIIFNDDRNVSAEENPDEKPSYGLAAKGYWGTGHIAQIRNYYYALENGIEPEITGEKALVTQKLVCGIYESGRKKERLYL